MIVYSHTLSPRLQYIVRFLSHYFRHPFKLTANEQLYATSDDFKINYSYQRIADDEIYIAPHALLFETEKRHVQVKCFEHNGYKAFFEASGELHFDLFAAIFFLLSRYEEYLPHKKRSIWFICPRKLDSLRRRFSASALSQHMVGRFQKKAGRKVPRSFSS